MTTTDDREVDDPEAELSGLLDALAAPRFWLHRHPVARLARPPAAAPPPPTWTTGPPTPPTVGCCAPTCGGRRWAGRPCCTGSARCWTCRTAPGPTATSRTKRRRALRAGVTWRPVEDATERSALIARAEAAEQAHPDATYRSDAPDLAHLADLALWLVAEDADGEPLLLSVTAVDGDSRSSATSDACASTPCQQHPVPDERGAGRAAPARGVRYLCDSESPLRLTSGLRRFSRFVGFRVHRVHCP